MTRAAVILAVAWLLVAACRTAYPDSPADHRALLDAIRQVESGGDDRAVGDNGKSLGAYQIGRAYWQDATRHGRVKWSYDRLVWSAPHCEQVMVWYWQKYGAGTDEARAKLHNGGPRGMSKRATEAYWKRVKASMKG